MTLTYATVLPVLLLLAVASAAAFYIGRWSARRQNRRTLPRDWAIMARPALNENERRALRLLREAMPEHAVLAKLPLVRMCQARDPEQVRYWYDLLAPLHVSFAICSANGRVLVAIDLESDRGVSRRALAIKQAVMEVCRIRYLSCRPENLPSASDLQLLLPQRGTSARTMPLQGPNFQQARSSLSDTVRSRRAERSQRWSDSSFQNDSFFAPDSGYDTGPDSAFAPAAAPSPGRMPPRDPRSASGR